MRLIFRKISWNCVDFRANNVLFFSITNYYQAKEMLRSKYEKMYTKDSVAKFFQILKQSDESRLEHNLTNLDDSALVTTIFEMLWVLPSFLESERLNELFTKVHSFILSFHQF